MRTLHIILDSPTEFAITKTELDIGLVTLPYQDIAHCIRAAFCISHDLRQWVHISICFDKLGPLTLHLDPKSIRFMGTDERSILLLVMRGQKAGQNTKRVPRTPLGVSVEHITVKEAIEQIAITPHCLLVPGTSDNWKRTAHTHEAMTMYCPLMEQGQSPVTHQLITQTFQTYHRHDLAILNVLHQMDLMTWARDMD